MSRIIEDYKNSDTFQDDVTEASKGAFNYGFLSYRSLIIKLFPNLDLSKVTINAAIEVISDDTATQLPTTPSFEAPPVEILASLTEVIIVEALPKEKAIARLLPRKNLARLLLKKNPAWSLLQ